MIFNPQPKKKRIQVKGRDWEKLRKEAWERQKGRCLDCKKWVPLHGTSVFDTAHLCHIKSKGSGGNDTPDNLSGMKCYQCHINGEHGPGWSTKTKGYDINVKVKD